ncbi:MAG TPA: O-antigen ligase [Thermotogota bacterium]|nr:O-antigen ligase [Thermotogota bacterium]
MAFLLIIPIIVVPYFTNNPNFLKAFAFIAIFFVALFIHWRRSKTLEVFPLFLLMAVFSGLFFLPSLKYAYSESLYYGLFQICFFLFLSVDFNAIMSERNLYRSIIVSGLIVSTIGYLNYYGISPLGFVLYGRLTHLSMVSTIGNVNFVMDFLASTLFLQMLSLFKTKGFWRILGYFSLYFSIQVLFLGQTRSVLLGLFSATVFIGLIFLNPQRRKTALSYKKQIFAIALIVIVALIFSLLPMNGYYSSFAYAINRTQDALTGTDTTGSLSGRVYMWNIAFEMFKKEPLLGHGFGSFKLLATDYGLPLTNREGPYYGFFIKPFEAHNDYLQWLAEYGIIGFSMWIMFIGYVLFHGLSGFKKKSFLEYTAYAGIIVILIHAFFEFPFYMVTSMTVFALFSKIITSRAKKMVFPKVSTLVLFAFLLFSLLIQSRFVIADSYYSVSQKKRKDSVELIQEYNRISEAIREEEIQAIANLNKLQIPISEEFKAEQKEAHLNFLNSRRSLLMSNYFKTKLEEYFLLYNAINFNPGDFLAVNRLGAAITELSEIFPPAFSTLFTITGFTSNYLTLIVRKAPKLLPWIPEGISELPVFEQEKIKTKFKAFLARTDVLNTPMDPYGFYHIAASAREYCDSLNRTGLMTPQLASVLVQWIDYGYTKALEMKKYDEEYLADFWNRLSLEKVMWQQKEGLLTDEMLLEEIKDKIQFAPYVLKKNLSFPMNWYDFSRQYFDDPITSENAPLTTVFEEWFSIYHEEYTKRVKDLETIKERLKDPVAFISLDYWQKEYKLLMEIEVFLKDFSKKTPPNE